jgi:oxygen-independent coproporphyrinogen-3 oxidase
MKIDKATILKFDRPGPRYTSYPTAPEWSDQITEVAYAARLKAFGSSDKTMSLYIHIPFCETLCYFCACTMNIRHTDEKYGDEYLNALAKELFLTRKTIGQRKYIKQLHWGGGTPSFLTEPQLRRLFGQITEHFDVDPLGEIAVEVDPRRMTESKVQTLRALGFNRISIGVQDFDEKVQQNINRIQPFELVERFHQWCREVGFASVNFDLIYGLPYQTVDSFQRTIEQVVRLRPDRIALYSFAYLPWLKKHHQKLSADHLPSNDIKLDIFLAARHQLLNEGYQAVAMDHFALEEDELAQAFRERRLYRNFMGYTVKPADEYLGLGVSAIGFLEKAFFQNHKTLPAYYQALKENRLPIERGKILSQDDIIRQWVISYLMCHFAVNKQQFAATFHQDFDTYFHDEQAHIEQCVKDGLMEIRGQKLIVDGPGKLFVRNICMGFDWYLRQKNAHQRFSRTV